MKFLKFFAFFCLIFIIVSAAMNSCGNSNNEKDYQTRQLEEVVSKKDTAKKQAEPTKTKSQDDIRFEELCDITMKHGVNFCYFYKKLVRVEDESIRQADKVFNNNYTKEYYDYQEQLYKTEKSKLFRKYNLDESLVYEILVFGGVYCK